MHRIGSFSPLYYIVQMAVFSESFWRRYRDVWWFQSGESPIVQRLFKTVHQGALNSDGELVLSTSAHAAAIRVAACNADCIGPFSPSLILWPGTFL